MVRTTAELLVASAPLGLTVAELAERSGLGAESGGRAALRHLAEDRAWPLAAHPRFAYPAPERPEVPTAARLIAAERGELPTLTWDMLPLKGEIGRALVALLDGSRDLDALAAELGGRADELDLGGIDAGRLREAIAARLEELGRAGALKRPG